MKYLTIILVGLLIGSVYFTNSYGITNENSENKLSDNFYAFGKGILEFKEKSAGPCVFAIPNYSVKSVNATNADSILNLDDFIHNFFIVLGNNNDDSYHYLQIGLPGGTGFPSYLLDLKNDAGEKLRGEFYVDYENLAVVLLSDTEKKLTNEGDHKKYFTAQSKDVTFSNHTYEPGNYNFGAILLKSDSSSWIDDDKCVLYLKWPFTISDQGGVVVKDPNVNVGRLVDVTEKFPPLKQYKAGVTPSSVDCKPGYRLLLNENESGDKRPACVTPETEEKLIERGWDKETPSYKSTKSLTTGSVSLDRTVYPIPFGTYDDFVGVVDDSFTPDGRSLFPLHLTAIRAESIDASKALGNGDLKIYIRINDPDFDVSDGIDKIAYNNDDNVGPLKISVVRDEKEIVLAYAGGITSNENGLIDVNADNPKNTRQLGPIKEVAPDAGIFELDFVIRYTDGPADSECPKTTVFTSLNAAQPGSEQSRFDSPSNDKKNYCILQGDILVVEYTDPKDASGNVKTVTDSAAFELRNGVLESDRLVYLIGHDIILTLHEPDFNLDSNAMERYSLDLIEWDSNAATVSLGETSEHWQFDPEPLFFEETGDETGEFVVIIKMPSELQGELVERGEEIVLEYTDWGPAGADYVGQEDEDINLTIHSSNFGATVELDQKTYTWNDKVTITIRAPTHNLDPDLVDVIGNNDNFPVKITSSSSVIEKYSLVETGLNTGIFTGQVTIIEFGTGQTLGIGPTDGVLEADGDDGITVAFDFAEDETVVGSAFIKNN